jgi:hypothetical protein
MNALPEQLRGDAAAFRREMREQVKDIKQEQARFYEASNGELHSLSCAFARLAGQLEERCAARGEILDTLSAEVDALKAAEHRRRGGIAVVGGIASAAGVLGGLAAKFWPWGY